MIWKRACLNYNNYHLNGSERGVIQNIGLIIFLFWKKISLFSDTLTATFRGRPLNGKIESVPSGYTGLSL